MSKLGWRQLVAGLGLAVLGVLPGTARAQGVTTGGITGTVTDDAGAPVEAAQVLVINRATGVRTGTVTRENGRYVVLGLETGSRYAVTVRRIGFQQVERENIVVPLSQTVRVDLRLERAVTTLSGVRVTADANAAIINATRTGVGTTVSDSALRRLPTINRNFTEIVLTTPQVSVTDASGGGTPRISAMGVNNRYNAIQIDGAAESDLFGLGATGQPGGQANGKSIGLESVKEYQVLLTPFDVRQGSAAGALINAVTKSGTNRLSGNAYWVNRNETLTRDRSFIPTYEQTQYGFTLGGPIIKDKVHFFLNPEFQSRIDPARGPFVGGTGAAAAYVDTSVINRFARILRDSFDIEPGDGSFRTNDNPLTNFFGRLDVQLPWRSRLVVRHNYGGAERYEFSRDLATGGTPTFNLTSQGYLFTSKKNSSVAQLFTNWENGANNELFVGYTTVRDNRDTPQDAPSIIVNVPRNTAGGARLRGGTENASHRNLLDQDVFEITNNFTLPIGSHRLTLGTRNEFYEVANLFGQRLFGEWTVNFTCPTANPLCNLDSLAAGAATQYQVGKVFPNDPNRGVARFRAASYAFYAQDQWSATDRLTITAGLRAEIPTFRDQPPQNDSVIKYFGQNTADVPSGNVQWAPRVGFNWDVTGDQRNQLRGGAGVFVGRPAYVWLGNAFQNSGLTGVGAITCQPTQGVPRVTGTSTQPAGTPQNCGANGDNPRAASPDINLLDPELKFPQFGRLSLGYDRRIGANWIATFEGIYNDAMYNFFFDNIAKVPTGLRPTAPEYRGRVIYGDSVAPNGQVTLRNVGGVQNAIRISNQSRDYSYTLTGGLRRQFINRFEGGAFYTYTQARDVQSYSSSVATSNWRQGRAVSGNLSSTQLGRSKFEQPHRIVVSGTYAFPTKTDLSLVYTGNSGQPYDYVYTGNGDLNGDGQVGNDLVYVPTSAYDSTQIRFSGTAQQVAEQQAAFEKYVNNEPCLREQRGRIMTRNTCRSPWQNVVNLSVRQSVPTFDGHNLTLQLDVFNFGNLLNRNWGRAPFINNQGSSSLFLLNQTGSTAAIGRNNLVGRPIFQFDQGLRRYDRNNIESQYQMQLTARYSF